MRTIIRSMVIPSLLAWGYVLLTAAASWGATYYVAPTGADSRSCATAQTLTTPKQTIASGLACLTAGDTLLLRAGTYPESIRSCCQTIPSGTSYSNAVTISGYPGEIATLTGASPTIIDFATSANRRYIIFTNLTIDGTAQGTGGNAFYAGTSNDHLRFDTVRVQRSGSGLTGAGMNGEADSVEVINSDISGYEYGFYIRGTNWLVNNSNIHDNEGYGVHIYNSGSSTVSGNVVSNNTIHNNGLSLAHGTDSACIILSSGSNNLAFNNLCYSHGFTLAGIQLDYFNGGTNNRVYNNTIYNNPGPCIQIGSGASGVQVRNNICYQNSGGIDNGNGATGTTVTNNLCGSAGQGCGLVGNPSFVNAGSANFALNSGSPAINAGTTLTEVTTDVAHVARPQGTAYDIGAYEFVETGSGGSCTSACVVYVSPTGSDAQACNMADMTHPRQTVAGGVACLTIGGSTLYIRGGTYVENIDTATQFIAGGTSWAAPTTIAAYANETVTLALPAGQLGVVIFRNATNDHYIVLDRLILNGQSTLNSNGLVYYPGTHHLRFQNGEVKNSYYESVYIYSANNTEVLNSKIHDSTHEHGVHVVGTSDGTLLSGNEVSNSVGSAIRADGADAPTGTITNTTITANKVHGNGGTNSEFAIVVGGSGNTGTLIANNAVWGNYGGILTHTGTSGAKLYNNTVYSNSTNGIQIDAGSSTVALINTISSENGGSSLVNNGTSTSQGTNLFTTPPFVNAGAGDFHLQSSATTAINVGTTVAEVTTDIEGTARPYPAGGAYDIGAYEFVGTPGTPTPNPPMAVRAWMTTGRFGR